MICTVGDCIKPARTGKAIYCAMHYHRLYRHGTVERIAIPKVDRRPYKQIAIAGHPLAAGGNKIYVHRVVLYEAIGEGEHPCHWCSRPVHWMARVSPPLPDDYLTVDHLDGDTWNNDRSNLVPACMPCNSARAGRIQHERAVAAGMWLNHDTVGNLGRPSDRFA